MMKIPIRVQKAVRHLGQPEDSRSTSHFQGELPTMQHIAYLFNSLKEHAGNVAELPDVEIAHDKVGVYDQDAVNGFSEQVLNTMLDIVNPGQASYILDAMSGNGNLTRRLYDYCERRGSFPPNVMLLELSRVQCELARAQLADTPAEVVWGNILTLENYD